MGQLKVREDIEPVVYPARNCIRAACLVCIAILPGIGVADGGLPATNPKKKSGEVYKNLKVLNHTPSDLLLSSMKFMTSSLGVHCEYCHVESAFERDDKKPKQTARQMMLMVESINNTEFHGKQEITCYSCHHGSPNPLAAPAIAAAPEPSPGAPASDVPRLPGQPSPADIIRKYIDVRGGTDAIANFNSLQEQGTFRSGSIEFPLELYATNSPRIAAVIHFPGADRITTFDGASGWVSVPGSPTHTMTPAKDDAIRLAADLQFALDPNKIFPEIKLMGIFKVGAGETFMLAGKRPGLPPVQMYFGVNSGLLLRVVHYSQSALGLNPTQTDYFDYREISGVKIPFHWISRTPEGSFSIQIENAKANEAIPDKMFSMPSGQQ